MSCQSSRLRRCCSQRLPLAQDYPTKPVTIVIPFAAGGAGDILARMLSPRLEKAFGRPFVVENKPGAGGVIGAVATARAEPDGHTIMIAPSPTMAVNVTLFKKLPYDPAADFVPLAMAAQTPFVLVVNPSLPVKSVADLIKWVKEQKGKVSYATAGARRAASPVRGAAQEHDRHRDVAGALQGQRARHHRRRRRPRAADVRRSRAGAVDASRPARCAPIGVSTAARVPTVPDVPPINDTVKGFDVASWQMVVAPAKTPRPIVDRLHAELKACSPARRSRARSPRPACCRCRRRRLRTCRRS